jgi:hypothetical protein
MPSGRFNWDHREALSALAAAANQVLLRIDQEKIREVRSRIDYKILEQLRPKDLFYQVLHGLQSLTQYDHSATLWIHEPGDTLEMVAETIAWKKGKSDRIGLKSPLPEPLRGLLRPGVVYGFDRPGQTWQEWTGCEEVGLAELLDRRGAEADPVAPLLAGRHLPGAGQLRHLVLDRWVPGLRREEQGRCRGEGPHRNEHGTPPCLWGRNPHRSV